MRILTLNLLTMAACLNLPVIAVAQENTKTQAEIDGERNLTLAKKQYKRDKELAKWKTETQGVFTVHSPPTGNSKIISFIGDVDFNTPKNQEALNRLSFLAEKACPGFNNQKFEPFLSGGSKSLETKDAYCSINTARSTKAFVQNGKPMVTYAQSPFIVVLLLESNSDPKASDKDLHLIGMAGQIESQLTPFIGLDGTPQRPHYKSYDISELSDNSSDSNAPNDTASSKLTSPASLKAAMDAIPRANRPIGMAMKEGEWDSYNMMVEYTAMVLFPGGVAIPATCRNWNPQKPPGPNMGCGITRYTLTNGRVTFSGDKEPADLSDFKGFTAGKSVSINIGNVSGGGASTFGGSISQVSGGELVMTPAGEISSGDWVANSIQGGNYSGYAGSNSKGITGKYYLDGFIIAVQDKVGGISMGFIGEKIEASDRYIYLNGEQFWK